MYRFIALLAISVYCAILIGCGVGKAFLSKQEWSENYTQMAGVTATSRQMIDGNLRTVGETRFPAESRGFRGTSPPSEVVITLPEKKMIRRVVIHSENLKTFDILADKDGSAKGPNWQLIKEVKSVHTNPTELSISTAFLTDKIRIRVLHTTSDSSVRRQQRARSGGGRRSRGNQRAAAKINEVELYGYKSADEG